MKSKISFLRIAVGAFWVFLNAGVIIEAASVPPELTPEDLETFLDGLLPQQLQREDIAGAVVSVVKDAQVFFSKGYGYADFEKRKPVSAENTLFRAGSTGKLFTWTSVMQLVEQGKLDLDRDIKDYLDFKITSTYSRPITLRNLMTHTPGFEEPIKDLLVAKREDLVPLRTYLLSHPPKQIFPPGTTPAYSNYGTSLAGYIVERVSGKKYENYVEEFIFKPLGMTHSTFRQPLPESFQKWMSNGYQRGSDDPEPFELFNVVPAGSLSTSGSDMARFMISHLQDGRFEDRQILRPETVRLMQSRQFELAKDANGITLGFWEEPRNGLRIIGHAGDTVYFHTDLHLIREKNLGFFISYNSAGRGEIDARTILWEAILDRYFPYNQSAAPALNQSKSAMEVSGVYTASRRSETTLVRMPFLLLQLVVSPGQDGTIQIDQVLDRCGKPKRFREIEPFVFREVNGQEIVVFRRDEKTSQLRLILRDLFSVYDKAPWYENKNLLLILIGFVLSVFVLTVILWPIAALVRKHYAKNLTLSPSEARLRRFTRLICVLNLFFLLIFAYFILNGFENLTDYSSRLDLWIHLLQVVGVVAVAATLLTIYNAFRTWMNRERGIWIKIHDALIAVACIGFVWIVIQGRLLNFNLNY
jgi:CubicO group peptidase (beta-lactamase class C family)